MMKRKLAKMYLMMAAMSLTTLCYGGVAMASNGESKEGGALDYLNHDSGLFDPILDRIKIFLGSAWGFGIALGEGIAALVALWAVFMLAFSSNPMHREGYKRILVGVIIAMIVAPSLIGLFNVALDLHLFG